MSGQGINKSSPPLGSLATPPALAQEELALATSPNPRRLKGRKRRFGLAGIYNVLLTNLVLQILLASGIVSLVVATLISQLVNTCCGYIIYGKLVFGHQGLRHHKPISKYLFLMSGMWAFNTLGISIGASAGINKNIGAAAMIPILATLSFILQKNWVFRS